MSVKTTFVALVLTIGVVLGFTQSAQAADGRFGKWYVSEGYDELTDKYSPFIFSYATVKDSQYSHLKPLMGMTCTSMYFRNLDVTNSGYVVYRTDGMSEARTKSGSEWQGSDGVSIYFNNENKGFTKEGKLRNLMKWWEDADKHFENMMRDSKLTVRFDSYSRNDQTIQVSLQGSSKAIQWLSAMCQLNALLEINEMKK